jgi:shikimate kinase
MRLYLIGFMGAGKTTVGALVAERLGVPFVDLDSEVERAAGHPVREVFARQGEAAFRAWESEALRRTFATPDVVVATGGGTLGVEANREAIARLGYSVWLHPSFATIVARIGAGKEDRPLFRTESEALALYRERLPLYRRADATIEIGADETAAEVAARLVLTLPRRRTEP